MKPTVDIRWGQQLPEVGTEMRQVALASVDFVDRLWGIEALQRGTSHVQTWSLTGHYFG